MTSPRIVFAGTPDFAATILDGLLAAGHRPVAVYTQPDRRRGRGRKTSPSTVKVRAQAADIDVFQPRNFRKAEHVEALRALQPDLLIVAAYGLILPETVLHIPGSDGRGAVNVHASLLPRWRGAAPVERAIMAGDRETGVCLMQMERGLDTGPVFAVRRLTIDPAESAAELEARLADLGASLLQENLQALLARTLVPTVQPETGIEYAHKITAADSVPSFSRAADLARQIQAMRERAPVTAWIADEGIRLLRARAIEGAASAAPGTLLVAGRKQLQIACGDGHVEITEIRLPRGKGTPMNAAAALNGFADLLQDGTRLKPERDT